MTGAPADGGYTAVCISAQTSAENLSDALDALAVAVLPELRHELTQPEGSGEAAARKAQALKRLMPRMGSSTDKKILAVVHAAEDHVAALNATRGYEPGSILRSALGRRHP